MKIIALMPKKLALFRRLELKLSRRLIIAVAANIDAHQKIKRIQNCSFILPRQSSFALRGIAPDKRVLVKCHAAAMNNKREKGGGNVPDGNIQGIDNIIVLLHKPFYQ
ncbi:hypothetical protein BG74_07690 [Sodalis-like endosymbiont of Proechinophthirus fluctus]|uniref:hypothetical protein n=1 Tax=Sodalis-like endosymbiont of Proechinophthirus fluctus TaxID=1462730 RepID=UPI0007A92B47|nr:hypothetical protein [Sodalis-like endosymbiont of Proechinophthirus fluctus]KYP96265.1 hypothetical protein BG74_07690 [Sodalis-like endosymbiont of Proechinophthirus fluctus]